MNNPIYVWGWTALVMVLCALILWIDHHYGSGIRYFLVPIMAVVVWKIANAKQSPRVFFELQELLSKRMSLPVSFSWQDVPHQLSKYFAKQDVLLQDSVKRYDALLSAFDSSPFGMVLLDEHFQIVMANPSACQHWHLSVPRDIGQRIHFVVRDPSFVGYLQKRVYDQSIKLSLRVSGNVLDQHVITIILQAFKLSEGSTILFSQNVTQEENLQQMRRDFITNASHELKTPITVINGYLENLLDLPLSEQEREQCLQTIHSQVQRMHLLVNDFLTLSRYEGTEKRDLRPTEMGPILQKMHQELKVLSAERHTIVFRNQGPQHMMINPIDLEIAVHNLLTNACRYTPVGETIELIWEYCTTTLDDYSQSGLQNLPANQEPFVAALRVRDTGLGIPEEHISRLTERFYRVDQGRSTATGGTGLGLAIVKHICIQNQIVLSIESSQLSSCHGSTFSLLFTQSLVCNI